MTGTPTSEPAGVGTVDRDHLLLVGAGPGLGLAVARDSLCGGYRVALVARSTDRSSDLAGSLTDAGAVVAHEYAADASDPEDLRACLTELYPGKRRRESSSITR